MVGSTLSGGWPDRRPPVRTTPQIGPDHPPNRAGPPHKSGRPPVRTTSKSGRTTAPKWSGQPGQGGWAKGSGPFFAVRAVFCGPDRGPGRYLRVRTVFCGSGPNGRPSARWPATPKIGPDQPPNRAGRPSGPPPESGRPGGRTGVRTPAPTTLWNARAARNRAHRGLFCPFFLRGA